IFALAPDDRTLAVANNEGRIYFLDARTLKPQPAVAAPNGLVPLGGFSPRFSTTAMAYSPNRSLLAVAGGRPGTIALLDGRTGQPVGHLLHVSHVSNLQYTVALSFAPDGRTLAVGVAAVTASDGCGTGSYWVTRFDIAREHQL